MVEGRDITTVVTPDAQVRILLTAAEDVRIARRSAELSPDAASTASQLRERDRRDAQVVDFLTAAPGVTTIDSTELDFVRPFRPSSIWSAPRTPRTERDTP